MSQPDAAPAVNRKLIYALVAVAVLALVFSFVVRPLLADDEVEPLPVPSAAAEADPPPAEGGEDAAEDAEDPLPETDEVFSARDPFQQLVSDDPPAESPPADGATGVVATAGTATPAVNPEGSPTATTAPSAQVGSTTVRLVDVLTGDDGQARVVVTVNETGYEVGVGQTFADRFRVLDVKDRCATFLFGDNRFVLCEGEQIRK